MSALYAYYSLHRYWLSIKIFSKRRIIASYVFLSLPSLKRRCIIIYHKATTVTNIQWNQRKWKYDRFKRVDISNCPSFSGSSPTPLAFNSLLALLTWSFRLTMTEIAFFIFLGTCWKAKTVATGVTLYWSKLNKRYFWNKQQNSTLAMQYYFYFSQVSGCEQPRQVKHFKLLI